MHSSAHAKADLTVRLNNKAVDPLRGMVIERASFVVEDWADALGLGDVWAPTNNWSVVHYQQRAALAGLPADNEVVYGKINGFGHIVHVSELS